MSWAIGFVTIKQKSYFTFLTMHSWTLAILSQTTQAAVLQLHSTSAPRPPSLSTLILLLTIVCTIL